MEIKDASGRYSALICAGVVVIVAAAQRLIGLARFSLSLDESTILVFANAIRRVGYPVVQVGTMEVKLATYELVPYFVALSTAIFGSNDFAARLPSAIFGILTSYLVFHIGWRWFNLRVGLVAGLLYACSPWAIYWGQNAFHPSQMQFFAFLTVIQAYYALVSSDTCARPYYLAALYFSCAYLSWEGIGFLLPILFVVAVIMRWGDWAWFRNRHLWVASIIVMAVVIAQGVRRVLLVDTYLLVGSGRGDVSLPELVFLKPYYIPLFYASQIFERYNHLAMTLVFIIGLAFTGRSLALRFTHLLTVIAVFFMANFLGYYSAHYIYYVVPVFSIAAAASLIFLVDMIVPSARAQGAMLLTRELMFTLFAGLVIFSSSDIWPKPWEISEDARTPPASHARSNIAHIDYKGVISVLLEKMSPGDVVINFAPFSLQTYGKIDGDYFIQEYTMQKLVFDQKSRLPFYLEKYAGKPALRSLEELQDMLNQHRRVWIVAAPYKPISDILSDKILDYIDSHMELVAETFDAKLFLWTQ